MELKLFMNYKFFLFIFISTLVSCDNKRIKLSENNFEEGPNNEEIELPPTEYYYGINLDSFSYITKKIKWGQNFSDILTKYGISNKTIFDASQKSKGIFNLRKIKKGNSYSLFFKKGKNTPSYFVYESSKYDYILCNLDSPISFKKISKPITYREKKITGEINSSLYLSFSDNQYPLDLVNLMVDVYAWQVDFFRIMPGDEYTIIYIEEIIDNKVVGVQQIKAAKLIHNNYTYFAISYDQGFGNDFFDNEGKSLRKTFLRAPLNFYRISSKFQKKRYHPVLKRYRDHLGTDYAAPRGTPIMSVGDGKVTEARWGRNNGNFVKIKHNNIYTTQYLHMSKFARGIKKGKIVKQGDIIGYVGSTGLATGPHVCFRFWRNGRQVDPYKQNDLPEGDPILKEHENAFQYIRQKYMERLEG